LAVGVVGVLALLATGLAVTQLTGSDGSDNPEAAVQAFFDAVDDEDALGVVESLSPDERDLLVPSVRKLADQLERVEVSEDVDLEKVGGVDLKVTDLELRTKGLHPDVAAVEVTGGTIAIAAKLADLPLGKVLSGALAEEGGRDLDEPLDASTPIDLTLVTVKSSGGWHVSLLYSLAEEIRAGSDAPVPDFGNGIPAKGAGSPTAAVEEMVSAFNDHDFGRMIELTPPDSMAVLHDYGPGLLAALEADDEDRDVGDEDRDGDEVDDESGLRLEDVELGEPEGTGDTRRLSLEGYRFVMSYDGEESMSYAYDGSCMTTTMPTWSSSLDDGSESADGTEEYERCVGETAGLLELRFMSPLGPLFLGPGEADIVVVERDGAWFVDPVRTVIDTFLRNIDAMSPEQAERMIENLAVMLNPDEDAWLAAMPAEWYEDCPDVDPPADDASFEERKDAGRRCSDADTKFHKVGNSIGDGSEDCYELSDDAAIDACLDELYQDEVPEDESSPSEDCWLLDDDAATESCLLAIGDVDGVGQLHTMACYELADGEVEACLQDLVDKGEIRADAAATFRCDAVYDAVSDGIDENYDEADAAYDQCMTDAGFGPDAEDGDGDSGTGSAPASTLPAPTTTTG
jgi:hypothetical protein